MAKKKKEAIPSPEEYERSGISCPYKQEAVDVTYIGNQLPRPNGKHRYSYKCMLPSTGVKSEKKYTDWIYD